MISLESALRSAATCPRASSTAFSASQPKACERLAALLVGAVFLAAALRRVERLAHRRDDVRDRDPVEAARERVAAAGPAGAVDQRVAPQLAEKLFQVRERDALALADAGERHRALAAVHGEVEHRGHCESSFGRQSHGRTLNGFEYLMNSVKYTQSRGKQSTIC